MSATSTIRDTANDAFLWRESPARPRLLLIGSLPQARDTLAELLDTLGYEVECASCAAEVEILRRPEAVVADLDAGNESAWEALKTLRQRAGWAEVPVIFVGRSAPTNANEAGFDGFLPKPVSIWALHRRLQAAFAA